MAADFLVDFAATISVVKGPVTLIALTVLAFMTIALAGLYAKPFHASVGKLMGGSALTREQRFRTIRHIVWVIFALSLLVLAGAFVAPIILRLVEAKVERTRVSAILATYAKTLDGSESEAVLADFAAAMKAFEQGDYLSARRRMLTLQREASSQHSRETLQGLITATYYARKEHVDGLRYLCEQYKGRPLADVRFRYQMHAHIRRIAINEGYEDAESVVAALRLRCHRADLSPVWAGIPLGAIENLVGNEYFSKTLDDADRAFLQYALDRYPRDSMQDHALFFLQRYEELVQKFPASMLMSMSLAGAAMERRSANDAALAMSFAERYLAAAANDKSGRYTADLTSSMVDLLGRLYLEAGRIGDARQLAESHAAAGTGGEIPGFMRSYAHEQLGSVANATELTAGLNRVFAAGIPANVATRSVPDVLPVVLTALEAGDFPTARNELEAGVQVLADRTVSLPDGWTVLRDSLSRLVAALPTVTPEGLLQSGIISRDEGRKDYRLYHLARATSMGVWKYCAETFPNSAEAAKARYLRGSLYRRDGYYRAAAGEFQALVRDYPNDDLADDALAELAAYQLISWQNSAMAEAYITLLTQRYSSANAVDNALYLAANFYLENGDAPRALRYYSRIAVNYGERRLASAASSMAGALAEVLDSESTRIGIAGLHIEVDSDWPALRSAPHVIKVEPGFAAEKAGFLWYDRVVSVDDEPVQTAAQFYAALARRRVGSEVRIGVRRGFGEDRVELRTTTAVEYYYAKQLALPMEVFGTYRRFR